MTLETYRRIEAALSQAEEAAELREPATKAGREIREDIRALLRKVIMARVRAEVSAESMQRERGRRKVGRAK